MMQDHKYTLSDLDNMIPWERELYVAFLLAHLEEERKRTEAQNAKFK